jgi:ankyrin repeat protein/energy-coupling factor transporter ATP-binding protein EcfA2
MEGEYDKSGSAGIKGMQYEVRLLLHFMVRALVNGYHSFHLASNMKAAGKFDDVVFCYRRNKNEPERLRLIQAKNTGTTTITADDLVSKPGEDFNLKKYLNSYNEIRNSEKFRGMEVQDVVLFTTRRIDKTLPLIQLSRITMTLDDAQDEDDILSFHGTASTRHKFSPLATEHKFPVEFMTKVALDLIKFMKEKRPIRTDTFRDSHMLLSSYVLDVQQQSRSNSNAFFKPEFLVENNQILSTETRIFQNIFIGKYKALTNRDFYQINEDLHKDEIRLKVFKRFGEQPKGQTAIVEPPQWPKNYLQDFFNHFTLAVNQPNEDQLVTFTKQRLHALLPFYKGKFSDFYLKLESQVVAWYTDKNGIWLTKDQAAKWVSKAAGQDFLGDEEKYYIPRTILWPRLRPESDVRNQTVCVCSKHQEFEESTGNAILVNEKTGVVLQFKGSLDAINEVVERDNLLNSKPKHCAMEAESKSDEDKNGPNRFSEEDLLEEVRGVAIISDAAGMGKSTILTHFCRLLNLKKPSTWVLRMDLNDPKLNDKIDQLNDTMNNDTAFQFLEIIAQIENDFERTLLRQRLKGNGEIVVMLDGFDEISDKFQKKIVSLSNTLMKCAKIHQLWIATRPNAKNILEETTGKLAFGLIPFSSENQVQFLADYGLFSKNERGKTKEECNSFAEKLLKSLSENIRDNEREFTGIPLHCQFLAEVFRGESSLPDHLNLSELYSNFWKRKFHIFVLEKCKNDQRNKNFKKTLEIQQAHAKGILQWHALRTIFKNKKELWEHLPYTDEDICPEWGLTGIDNRFIHQTFAEYFASLFFSEQIRNENVCDFLIEIVFCDKRYRVVRCFMNGLLREQGTTGSKNRDISSMEKHIKEGINTASKEGNEVIIQFILNEVTNRDQIEKELLFAIHDLGHTPLQLSSENGNEKVVELLLNFATGNNLDPHILFEKDENGRTPLHLASENGHEKVVELLMNFATENNLDPHILFEKDENGRTPLHLASENGNEKVVELLLNFATESNLDPHILFNKEENGGTPLQLSSENGNEKVVELLLNFATENNIDPHILFEKDENERTSLHLASENGHEKVVELLLNFATENNIDPNILFNKDENDGKPLHLASENGHEKMVQLLLKFATENNIDPNILFEKDENGRTPLQLASENGHEKVVELLLNFATENHLDPNIIFKKDENDRTPLHWASKNGHTKVVLLVLNFATEYNIDPNILFEKDEDERTSLHYAVVNGSNKMVELLLNFVTENNVDPNIFFAKDITGRTPLYHAATYGHEKVVELLLNFATANQIDLNILFFQDEDGRTAIHDAAENGHEKVLQLLLNFPTDSNIDQNMLFEKNEDARTMLHDASEDSKKVVDLLLNYAAINKSDQNISNDNDQCGTARLYASQKESRHEIVLQFLLNLATENKMNPILFFDKNRLGSTALHDASEKGHEKMVQLLLKFATENNIDPNILFEKDENGRTPLKLASENGHEKVVQLLLKFAARNNIDPNILFEKDVDARTPLHDASENGHEKVVQLLLKVATENNIDPSILFEKDVDARTPLHDASRKGREKVVGIILNFAFEKKIDPNILFAKDEDGSTPLHDASFNGHEKVVKMLVNFATENKIDSKVFFSKDEDGSTPLHDASFNGHEKVVKMLVNFATENKIDSKVFFSKDMTGRTPLHFALENGDGNMVELLLNFATGKKNDRNILLLKNKDGRTQLHYASEKGHEKVLKLLLNFATENNVDRNILFAKDNRGRTPLHYASIHGHEKVIDFFLNFATEHTMDPNILLSKDERDRTPLHYASVHGHEKVMELLLNFATNKIDPNILFEKDTHDRSPLHYSSLYCREKIVELLLNFASLNSMDRSILSANDEDDNTPLHYASESGHEKVVEMLLNFASKNNIYRNVLVTNGKDGRSPLHDASINGHEKVMELLLNFATENKIDPNILFTKDKDGNTPLHDALIKGHKKVIELLLKFATKNNIGPNILFGNDESGNEKEVELLLNFATKNKINENILFDTDEFGRTLLHYASIHCHGKMMEFLLNFATTNSIHPNIIFAKEEDGRTPLHYASRYGHKKVVQLLLSFATENKIDPIFLFGKDDDAKTPLHLAIENGHEEVVELLSNFATENNVDRNILFTKNEDGSTPLYYASNYDHGQVVQLPMNFATENIDPNILFTESSMVNRPLRYASGKVHEKDVDIKPENEMKWDEMETGTTETPCFLKSEFKFRLALYFLTRFISTNLESFFIECNLDTEIQHYDVIFLYNKNKNDRKRLHIGKILNLDELLDNKGNIDLTCYFNSFTNMKKGKESVFSQSQLEELVIYTTAKEETLTSHGKFTFEETTDNNDLYPHSDTYAEKHCLLLKRLKLRGNVSDEMLEEMAQKPNLHGCDSIYDLRQYLKHLRIVVIQPNKEELIEYIKQRIQIIFPFAPARNENNEHGVDAIYDFLERKMKRWHQSVEGTWLSKYKALQWLEEASNQSIEMINPLENPRPIRKEDIKWDDLKRSAKYHLLSRGIVFQGTKMSLDDLNYIFLNSPKNIMNVKIISMLAQKESKVEIGEPVIDSAGYSDKRYIERSINWPTLKQRIPSRKEMRVCYNEEEFKYSSEKVLLFVKRDKKLLLRFKGSLDEVRGYITTNNSSCNEEQLVKNFKGIGVISGDTGSGKSTILNHFTRVLKRENPKTWVLRFNCKDKKIKEITENKLEEKNTIEALKCLANLKNELEEKLFLHRIEHGGIVFMFDDFDEIPKKSQMKLIQVLKASENTKINQIWLSTKPHMKSELEKTFGTIAFKIPPFSNEKQKKDLIPSDSQKGKWLFKFLT